MRWLAKLLVLIAALYVLFSGVTYVAYLFSTNGGDIPWLQDVASLRAVFYLPPVWIIGGLFDLGVLLRLLGSRSEGNNPWFSL